VLNQIAIGWSIVALVREHFMSGSSRFVKMALFVDGVFVPCANALESAPAPPDNGIGKQAQLGCSQR
jgi:hypothetical protein